ncbi:MAG: hypothetical protein IPH00_16550 [Flavobacteriales bacterium]|nr:hypothetical protein [Flavobacteriales bacterium]MBK7247267.1 hypothetical protein [Flavobacteriales bacterium]HQY04119.1 hypothetical protein [Flavobacteriales bacterium]
MSKKKELPEGVTEAQLKALEAKHGRVYPVVVKVDGKTRVGLFRKPRLMDMSAASTAANPLAIGDALYSACKLAADPAMDTDEEVHLAAVKAVAGIFRVLEAEVGEPYGSGE